MADGTVTIDFDVPLTDLESKISQAEQIIKSLGTDTSKDLDEKFTKAMEPLKNNNIVIKANTTDADAKLKTTEQNVEKLPKSKETEVKAKAETAQLDQFKAQMDKLPKEKQTELNAKAVKAGFNSFEDMVGKVPKEKVTDLLAKTKDEGLLSRFKDLLKSIPHETQTDLKVNADTEKVNAFTDKLKNVGVFALGFKAVSSAIDVVKDSVGGAIQRFDTLNNYPKVLQSLGVGAGDAKQSIKELSEGVQGLPTSLDQVAKTSQRMLPIMHGDIEKATEATLAMNDAFLASGASGEDASRGLEQYTQMLSSGKVDIVSWKTLQETMPGALEKVSESFGNAGDNGTKLYAQLQSGEITVDQLNDRFIKLDKGVNGFHQTALTATGGIGTAFTNMKNRITAGIADAIKSFDEMSQKATGKGLAENLNVMSAQLGTTLKNIGKSIGELTPIFAVITKAGEGLFNTIKTTWNGALSSLKANMDTVSKSDFAEYWKGVGKNVDDFFKKIQPVAGAIGGLVGVLGGAAWNTAKNLIKGISEAFDGVGSGAKGAEKSIQGISQSFNAIASFVAPVIEPLGQIVGLLAKGIWETIVGTIKAIGSAFKTLNDNMPSAEKGNALSKALQEIASHKEAIENVGKAIALIGISLGAIKGISAIVKGFMAFGEAVIAIKNVVTSIKSLEGAMALLKLAFATNPVGIIVTALVALGVALVAAYKNIKPFRDAVDEAFSFIKKLFTGDLGWEKAIGKALDGIIKTVQKWASNLGKAVETAFKTVSKFFTGKLDWEKAIGKALDGIIKTVQNWGKTIGKAFETVVKTIGNVFKGIGTAIMYAFILPVGIAAMILKPLVEPLKKAFNTLVKDVQNIWNGLVNWLKPIFTAVINAWEKAWDGISDFFTTLWEGIKSIITNAITAISKTVSTILGTIRSVWETVWGAIKDFFETIWNGMKAVFDPIIEAISNAISTALSTIQGIWETVWGAIKDFFGSVWDGMKAIFEPIISGISSTISSTLDTISNVWNTMWNGLKDAFGGIWDGIKQAAADGMNAVIGVINAGVDAIDGVWKFFTGHETSIHHLGKVSFEQGGTVKRHLSVINDAADEDWKELLEFPDGTLGMSQQRNWTGYLPEGTKVHNGKETKAIMSRAGIRHYADGGIIGSLENAAESVIDWGKGSIENIGSWLGDKFTGIMKFLAHPLENTKSLIEGAAKKVMPTISGFADLASGTIGKIVEPAGEWVKKNLEDELSKMIDAMGAGGAMPAEAYGPMIRAAAAYMHQDINDFNVDMIERIIGNESGGNPAAINLWDSNAMAGTPSKGILQFIDPTFNNYAMPGHTNIWNPMDQLIALFNDATWRGDMGMGYNGKYGEWTGNASGPSGPRMYGNGGEILKSEMLIAGEDGKEYIVNPNKDTADELLAKAITDRATVQPGGLYAKIAQFMKAPNDYSSNSTSSAEFNNILAQSDQMNSAQHQIENVPINNQALDQKLHLEVHTDLDGREIGIANKDFMMKAISDAVRKGEKKIVDPI
jgi:tape measure domain-containing protein